MPELPDISVFCKNLKKLLEGKEISKVKAIGKKLPDSQAALTKALVGKKIKDVFRSGKEMRFLLTDGTLLGFHLMLTGDMFVFDKKNDHHSPIVEIYFKNGGGIVLADRMQNASIRLNPVDKKGIDALDKSLNYTSLKKLLHRRAQIKNILLDQDLIRGIGNSYSDEILWATKISPFSVAELIPDKKIKELAQNIKKILKSATRRIDKKYPGLIHGEIKEFLKVHTKKKEKSPTGGLIKIEKRGFLNTFYTNEQVLYK